MHLKFTQMIETRSCSLPSKGTGSGSEFPLDFVTQPPNPCTRLLVLLAGMTREELLAFFEDVLVFSVTFKSTANH